MINGGDEVLGAAEPEGAVADRLDLVVHTLNGAIRNPRPGPCENPISRGEFIINGFRDKDLQDLLYPKHRAIPQGIAPPLGGHQP